jgi:hypothetical protein
MRFRPRFTLRSMMAAIALASLFLGYRSWRERMDRLSHWYSRQSNDHLSKAHIIAARAYEERRRGDKYQEGALIAARAGDMKEAERLKGLAVESYERFDRLNWLSRHHDALAWKYWRASDRPWLPVNPDSAPPDP